MTLKITKTNLYLGGIFILALVLRILAALHAHIGPDEIVYSIIPFNIISAGRLGTVEQSPLYFYLVDLGYMLFGGVTAVSTRLTSIVFGSLTVFIVYLITRELFENKRAGLLSALLFAISGYTLRYNYETDMTAYFFALLSMLLFLWSLRGRALYLYGSAVSFALGVMAKDIVLLLAPAYAVVWLWHLIARADTTPSFRISTFGKILVAVVLFLLTLSPIFLYNYILLKEKGITDYHFSNELGIGETVHKNMLGRPWNTETLKVVLQKKARQFMNYDAVLVLLGAIGIYLGFARNKKGSALLIVASIVLVGYTAGLTASNSHYIWAALALSVFGGYGAFRLCEMNWWGAHKQKVFIGVVVIAVAFSIVIAWDVLFYSSSILELREYVHENIPEDALVAVDPQIYQGIYAWVFNDRHYVEARQFRQLLEIFSGGEGSKQVPVYYIECGEGTTCLWSTEDTERLRTVRVELTEYFRSNTELVTTIRGSESELGNRHTFIVRRGNTLLPDKVFPIVDRTHVYYFYPVGWKFPELAVDTYTVSGFRQALHVVGIVILYADVLLSLLSMLLVGHMVYASEKYLTANPTQPNSQSNLY